MTRKRKKMSEGRVVFIIFVALFILSIFGNIIEDSIDSHILKQESKTLNILSSYDNADLENNINKFAKKMG